MRSIEIMTKTSISKILFIILVSACCGSAYASVLSDLVAKMPNRTFKKMPFNASLQKLNINYSQFYFADSGDWDSVKHRLIWVGGPGKCCTKHPDYKMIQYNEMTNAYKLNVS